MERVSMLVAFSAVLFLFSTITSLQAQHEYDVWQFGDHSGLDFRGANPVVIPSKIRQEEGCASICNRRTGEPLFYTDGVTVWNRENKPMPNGTGLFGHKSSAQSALIVPMPGDTNRYYIFTSDQQGYDQTATPVRGVNYSIVDMRLNGRLGDVAQKNVPVQKSASERLTAVRKGNGHDYWVITHSVAGNVFRAWSLTGAGLAAIPVVSVAGVDQGKEGTLAGFYTLGVMKASPNGRKLAITTYSLDMVELFDFNPATGRVGNGMLLYRGVTTNGGQFAYGVTFSPDNSKLYHSVRGDLVQYDITSGIPHQISASRRTIVPHGGPGPRIVGSMQTGPDGRIYLMLDSVWVGAINHPNAAGDACGYTPRWKKFTWDGLLPFGLPNNIDARLTRATRDSIDVRIFPRGPLMMCYGERVMLTADAGFARYRWSTGETTRTITVDRGNTYSVSVFDSLGETSSANVVVHEVLKPQPVITGADRVCDGDSITLAVATDSSVRNILWSTGETTPTITVRHGGSWSVTLWNHNGCSGDTSFTVISDPAPPTPHITGERAICDNGESLLDAGAGYQWYRWSTGDTTRTIVVDRAGVYSVMVGNNNGCRATATPVEVTIKPGISGLPGGRTIGICAGESLVLEGPVGYASWRWSTGETTQSIVVSRSGVYNVVVTDASGCSGVTDGDTVIILAPSAKPTITAAGGILTASSGIAWQWYRDGMPIPSARSQTCTVSNPGLFSVAVTDSNGCRATSDPFTVGSPRRVWLDTVQTRVGEPVFLTMRISPPLTAKELIGGYSVRLMLPRGGGLYSHGVVSPDEAVSGESATMERMSDGTVILERPSGSVPLVGEELFKLKIEGMSTGRPENHIDIAEITLHHAAGDHAVLLSVHDDSVVIAGGGLVLLTGCDVAHGFAFGKRGHLRTIAPNPVEHEMTVTYVVPEGSTPRLRMIDPTGREVRTLELPAGTGSDQAIAIDVRGISSGLYMMELRDGAETSLLPVLVVK